MTKSESKDHWLRAWNAEARYLTRAYQCNADPELFDRFKAKIGEIQEIFSEIADRMEKEGVWNNKDGK